jgi:hypothetical protein
MTNRLEDQLNHPLYKRAKEIWERIRFRQIKKASEKYPEPLNHRSWSAIQLVEHGIMENVDQLHYYICLLEKIEDMESRIADLTSRSEKAEKRAEEAEKKCRDILAMGERERRKWANLGR